MTNLQMTATDILSIAYDCGCMSETCTDSTLYNFAMNLICIERSRCVDILETLDFKDPEAVRHCINKIRQPEVYEN